MKLPRLYTFRRCPYAMRARMALLQAGRDFEAVEVSLRDKPASLLALSPKATVPVLHLPDDRVIEESWDIMRWALAAPDALGFRVSEGADHVGADARKGLSCQALGTSYCRIVGRSALADGRSLSRTNCKRSCCPAGPLLSA